MGAGRDELLEASQRAQASLTWARLLIADGYASPALVWSVRSVEIFLKEFVLAALFMEQDDKITWERAVRKARNLFETLSWRKAFDKMNEEFGPLDPMTTADGQDVLVIWEKEIVPARHNIVHGREEASPEFAIQVYEWAERLVLQLKLRFVVAGKHPFADVFMNMYAEAYEAYHGHPPPKE